MRLRTLFSTAALISALAGSAAAQTAGPSPATPPIGNQYTPIYGGTLGIAIPVGRLADDHAAGYTLGGLVEYGVVGQPLALRGELIYQHFALKTNRTTGSDVNVISLGPTVVYKLQPSPINPFLTGGIAIYHATDEGTRPGINFGAGSEIPLTGFSASVEARLHVMLADNRPIVTLPLTVGIRF
jgi:hypothetical protein